MRMAAEGGVSGESVGGLRAAAGRRSVGRRLCHNESIDLPDQLTIPGPPQCIHSTATTGMALQTGANSVRPSQLDLSTMSYELGVRACGRALGLLYMCN